METFDFDSQAESLKPVIANLKAGQRITAYFILRKKELRTKRDSNELYLSLELGDASGRITGSLWQNAKETYQRLEIGKPVKVLATAIDFKGKLHFNIERVRATSAQDSVDPHQFIPATSANPTELYSQLLKRVNEIDNKYLHRLLSNIFNDQEIKTQFMRSPGGKLWHHAYKGGLLEHTVAVAYIVTSVAELYPEVDSDILVAGALLHDFGKTKEYKVDGMIDFSDEGRLHGHITIGYHFVADQIKQIADFPKSLRDELLHLILSHQGSRENASPVPPMTIEAMILYYADELDSKANALQRIRVKEGQDRRWSSFIQLLDRFIYFGSDRNSSSIDDIPEAEKQ